MKSASSRIKRQFKDTEQLHLRYFLIAILICSLGKQLYLLFGCWSIFSTTYSIRNVALDVGYGQISIFIRVIFLEDYVYRFADLLVTIYHQEDQFTVVLGEKHIVVDKRIAEVSQYLHNLLSMGLDEEEIQINPDIVSIQIFDQFINFCRINNYKQPDIAKRIRTNNLSEVLDEQNYNFIKEYHIDEDQIYKLLNAANFFVCHGLQKLIAAVFACKIYFQDTKAAFESKKKEMNIDKQITFEEDEFYKSNYFFEENK